MPFLMARVAPSSPGTIAARSWADTAVSINNAESVMVNLIMLNEAPIILCIVFCADWRIFLMAHTCCVSPGVRQQHRNLF